jgi:hypothetical protein
MTRKRIKRTKQEEATTPETPKIELVPDTIEERVHHQDGTTTSRQIPRAKAMKMFEEDMERAMEHTLKEKLVFWHGKQAGGLAMLNLIGALLEAGASKSTILDAINSTHDDWVDRAVSAKVELKSQTGLEGGNLPCPDCGGPTVDDEDDGGTDCGHHD